MTTEQTKLVEDNIGLVGYTIRKYYPHLNGDEDIYQACCVKLVKAAIAYKKGKNKFSTYAVASIKNGVSGHFQGLNRKKRKSNNFTKSLDEEVTGLEDVEFKDVISIKDFADNADINISLQQAYEMLEDIDNKILAMRLEGYTFDAIGKRLGMTKQNVQHRINSKIKPVLRELLEVAS